MKGAVVAILMGSKSDFPSLEPATVALRAFGIPYEIRVMSAHRTPSRVVEFVSGAADAGYRVIIAAAGGAAHLAGVVAAHTILPVIGVPVAAGTLGGFDALLATVQEPLYRYLLIGEPRPSHEVRLRRLGVSRVGP